MTVVSVSVHLKVEFGAWFIINNGFWFVSSSEDFFPLLVYCKNIGIVSIALIMLCNFLFKVFCQVYVFQVPLDKLLLMQPSCAFPLFCAK